MRNNYLNKILELFFRFDYSKPTVDRVHRWLADAEKLEEKDAALRELWAKTKADSHIDTERSFGQVLDKLGLGYVHIPDRFNRQWRWRMAAAVIAGVILSSAVTFWLSYALFDKDNAVMTEQYAFAGERKNFLLPDGTQVYLNADSHIYYPENLEGKTRTVYLTGEATFKVVKNPKKPFIVRAGNMDVTALGTEFNVKAYLEDELLIASLIEGKVRVDCNDTLSYVLDPGNQVVYNKISHSSAMQSVSVQDVTAWQRGQIILTKASVGQIVRTLERHFGMAFHVSGGKSNKDLYNFVFNEDADIREVLEVMQVVVGPFEYQLKNRACYIYW